VTEAGTRAAALKAIEAVVTAPEAGLDMPATARSILRQVAGVVQADGGCVFLSGGGSLDIDLAVGDGIEDCCERLRSLAGTVTASCEPVLEFDQEVLLGGEVTRVALMGLPMKAGGDESGSLRGAMVLATRDPARIDQWNELSHLGYVVALVLERARFEQERETQRARVSLAIQASSDSIMIVDREGRIEAVSPALERLTGFSRKDLVGRDSRFLVEPRSGDGLDAGGMASPALGSPSRGPATLETNIRTRNGQRCCVELTQTPMSDSQGRLMGIAYTLRDVTDGRETERLRDDFISLVSHEFRSPITVIMGMASTLLRKEMTLPGVARSGLRDIVTQASRLNRLVDNLLAMTRSRAGKLELSLEHVKIGKLAGKVVKDLHSTSRSCSFVLDLPADLPAVAADSSKIELVLRNLLENAVKFSPAGGRIRIWGREEDSVLVIRVEDEGMGMAAEHLHDILLTSYRLKDRGVKAGAGVGLGLAACQRVIEAHGGRIWAQSEKGKGTVFAFTLPIPKLRSLR